MLFMITYSLNIPIQRRFMSAKNERGNFQVSGKILNENNADIYFDVDSWK